MTPLQQLQQQNVKIALSNSTHEVLYDFCPDFDFIFDVEITKKWHHDPGTAYAPETWESEHKVDIHRLQVIECENYEPVSVDNEDEIIKELLNKIEII